MSTWTTQTVMAGPPEEVLDLLTEADAIARWAPVPFELVDLPGRRLRAGSRARVRGSLIGLSVEFDVDVQEADQGRLSLRATGPIAIDVEYVARAIEDHSEVSASVSVSGRGIAGRVLARATDTLLAAGALTTAMRGIERELAPSPCI